MMILRLFAAQKSKAIRCAVVMLLTGHAFFMAPALADDLVPMVLELLASPDRDTRGLALQQVREGIPGQAATRQLAELLPRLDPDGQSALIDALAERGDSAARPAIVKASSSPFEPVRVAALRALGRLGRSEDVALLAIKAAEGSAPERQAAQKSLAQLPGPGMTRTIIDCFSDAAPAVKAELLQVLAARKAQEAMPIVLQSARAAEPALRIAALRAAHSLAGPLDAGPLIEVLAAAGHPEEHDLAESALLALSGRCGERCLDPVLAALPNSNVPTRISLLRALATIRGSKALEAMTRSAEHNDASVQNEALRLLAEWREPEAGAYLLRVAQQTTNSIRRTLALRGVIRVAAEDPRPASIDYLRAAWRLAGDNASEQRLVLGALGAVPSPELVELAAQALMNPEVAEEAALACVLAAEKLEKPDALRSIPALRRVLERTQNPAVRLRAERRLRELEISR